jgi:hypothetical protein
LSWDLLGRRSVFRRVGGELHMLDIHGRQLYAVVEDDALEPGERIGPGTRAADRPRSAGARSGRTIRQYDGNRSLPRWAQTDLCWWPLGNIDSGASAYLTDAGRLRAACNWL